MYSSRLFRKSYKKGLGPVGLSFTQHSLDLHMHRYTQLLCTQNQNGAHALLPPTRLTVNSDLPVWLEQSPGQTSCHVWQSTDRLLHHSWPCQPWPGSLCFGLSCGHCYWGRWVLRCDTRTADTPRSPLHRRTVKPGFPRCLSPSADSPRPWGAL